VETKRVGGHVLKSNNSKQNNIMVNKEQLQRNNEDIKENKSSTEEKDGFRYDYDDSSDLK
jgi:hypothetical protein